jgi:hypothetical protein
MVDRSTCGPPKEGPERVHPSTGAGPGTGSPPTGAGPGTEPPPMGAGPGTGSPLMGAGPGTGSPPMGAGPGIGPSPTGAGPGTGPPPTGAGPRTGPCTVVSVNGTLVEAKMWTFTLECTHFLFNKCPIYTHDAVQVPNFALVETKWIAVWNAPTHTGYHCAHNKLNS